MFAVSDIEICPPELTTIKVPPLPLDTESVLAPDIVIVPDTFKVETEARLTLPPVILRFPPEFTARVGLPPLKLSVPDTETPPPELIVKLGDVLPQVSVPVTERVPLTVIVLLSLATVIVPGTERVPPLPTVRVIPPLLPPVAEIEPFTRTVPLTARSVPEPLATVKVVPLLTVI
jgi:hypothetical protein